MNEEIKTLPPHSVVGFIKFATDKETFHKLSAQVAVDILRTIGKDNFSFKFDQLLVVGNVEGEAIQELRFIKFIKDEQTILQTDNGGSQ